MDRQRIGARPSTKRRDVVARAEVREPDIVLFFFACQTIAVPKAIPFLRTIIRFGAAIGEIGDSFDELSRLLIDDNGCRTEVVAELQEDAKISTGYVDRRRPLSC